MRCDHFDASFGQASVQRIAAVGTVADRPLGSFVDETLLDVDGVTKPVSMDFTFEDKGSGTTAHFSGVFELERLQFGVGEGFWSDTS